MKYDPQKNPNPTIWLSLDEQERVFAVQKFHSDSNIKLPNAVLHSVFHVIVENQVALGDDFIAKATLERLMAEGLDRHEAIHAIGSVVATHVHKTVSDKAAMVNATAVYQQKLNALSAAEWKKLMQ